MLNLLAVWEETKNDVGCFGDFAIARACLAGPVGRQTGCPTDCSMSALWVRSAMDGGAHENAAGTLEVMHAMMTFVKLLL